MTKQELIKLLEQYPDDMEIFIDRLNDVDSDFDNDHWTSGVREPNLRLKMVKNGKIAQRPCKETSDAKKSLII